MPNRHLSRLAHLARLARRRGFAREAQPASEGPGRGFGGRAAAAGLAPALALALVFAGAAAPARAASEEDVARFLAGAITLAIIGKVISDANDRDKAKAPIYQEHRQRQQTHRPRDYRFTGTYRPGAGAGTGGHRERVLPASCLRVIDTDHGQRRAVGAPCLQRNGVNTARLPDRCEGSVRTPRGRVDAWGAGCLTRAGYRFD
jgi:hypothetical protein